MYTFNYFDFTGGIIMSGMKFECFYYPVIENGEVVRTTKNIKHFEYGEEVPTKTLYYNYGKNEIQRIGNVLLGVQCARGKGRGCA